MRIWGRGVANGGCELVAQDGPPVMAVLFLGAFVAAGASQVDLAMRRWRNEDCGPAARRCDPGVGAVPPGR